MQIMVKYFIYLLRYLHARFNAPVTKCGEIIFAHEKFK